MGIPELAKIEYFPLNKSQILVRLENIDDIFSHRFAAKPKDIPFVRVYDFAMLLL